jgi:predicted N-acetyltransferase YhbS
VTQVVDVQVEPYLASQAYAVHSLLDAAGWACHAMPSITVLCQAAEQKMAFVAWSPDNKIVGFARVISDGESVSYLAEIVVDAAWQRRGVGRELIKACAARFPKTRLDLLSTLSAQPFYVHLGFAAKQGYRKWP